MVRGMVRAIHSIEIKLYLFRWVLWSSSLFWCSGVYLGVPGCSSVVRARVRVIQSIKINFKVSVPVW